MQSIRSQADVLEVQTWGCASLRELARDSEDRGWLGRLGGIELVLQAMRSFEDVDLQVSGAQALGMLSYEHAVNANLVLQHGGLELLIRGMHRHYDNEALQASGLSSLQLLCSFEELREHFVQLQGLQMVFAALERHPLQGPGCGLLGRLAYGNREHLRLICDMGGAAVALEALNSLEAETLAPAAALLGNLALEMDLEPTAAPLLVEALRHEAVEVKEAAVNALKNVCVRTPKALETAAAAGAYEALAFVQTEKTRLLTTSLLSLLCEAAPELSEDFRKAGGLTELLATMRDHTAFKAQEQLATILHCLGQSSAQQILKAQGLSLLLRAMHLFPGSAKIQARWETHAFACVSGVF